MSGSPTIVGAPVEPPLPLSGKPPNSSLTSVWLPDTEHEGFSTSERSWLLAHAPGAPVRVMII